MSWNKTQRLEWGYWKLGLYGYKGTTKDRPPKLPKRIPASGWVWLLASRVTLKLHASKRAKAVSYCNWAIKNRAKIFYKQLRPMGNMNDLLHLPVYEDCSEFVTKACKRGKLPDPSGYGYNGSGNTDTMLAHLPHILLKNVLPGDIGIFAGPDFSHHHAVMFLERGRGNTDPNVASHGSDVGPLKIKLNTEWSYHAGQPLVCLKVV